MKAAQAASPRLPFRSARSAQVAQRVVAPLSGDDGAATPLAAHRLLVDPPVARGPRADDALVERMPTMSPQSSQASSIQACCGVRWSAQHGDRASTSRYEAQHRSVRERAQGRGVFIRSARVPTASR